MVHVAAAKGEDGFLSNVLLVKEDNKTALPLAFFALLARDKGGRTPLALAIEAKNGPAVLALLTSFQLFFTQKHALPLNKTMTSQENHLSELFPIYDLCKALKWFPNFALEFVSKLSLVSSGDKEVQEGIGRFDLGPSNGSFVTGSERRVPRGHWKKAIEENKQVRDRVDKGAPVKALFVPLKNVASRESEFLKSVVDAAKFTGKLKVFENSVMQAVIDHKWNAYARRWFFWHVTLYFTMVATLTVDGLVYQTITNANSDEFFYKTFGRVPMIVTMALWVFFARLEFKQIAKATVESRSHFSEFWNAIDAVSLISIAATYTFRGRRRASRGVTS